MRRYRLLLAPALLLAACSGGGDPAPTVTPTAVMATATTAASTPATPGTVATPTTPGMAAASPTALPPTTTETPGPSASPGATGTPASGNYGVDLTIAALSSGDASRAMGRVHLREMACVAGAPGPSCPEGESPGTTVRAFQLIACEGEFVASQSAVANAVIRGVIAAPNLYAVAKTAAYGEGGLVLLMVSGREPGATGVAWLLDSEGMITGLNRGCDQAIPIAQLPAAVPAPEWVIPPPP